MKIGIIAVLGILVFSSMARAESLLQPIKPEKTITRAKLVAQVVKKDMQAIAADRAHLKSLAGKSGVEQQRESLLGQIAACEREIGLAKSSTPLHFSRIDAGRHLPKHAIGYIVFVKVFQILTPTSALCRVDYDVGYIQSFDSTGGADSAPQLDIEGFKRPVLFKGFNFSDCANGDRRFVHCLISCNGTVSYKTVGGASNTVLEIIPIRVTKQEHSARKPQSHLKKNNGA